MTKRKTTIIRPSRAEQLRLKRILDNEDYGPKLVRLNKSQQRVVLDLISANKGREARTAILKFDEERLTKVRTRRKAKPKVLTEDILPSRPPTPRLFWEYVAMWIKTHLNPNLNTKRYVEKALQNSGAEDYADVAEALGNTADMWRQKASNANREFRWSPFYYH